MTAVTRVYLPADVDWDVEPDSDRAAAGDTVRMREFRYAHLTVESINPGGRSLCGLISTSWHGTGSWAEMERAESMPTCPRCNGDAGK